MEINNKIIHFLENDYKCPDSDADIQCAKRHLKYGGINVEDINNMVIQILNGIKNYFYMLKKIIKIISLLKNI